METAIPATSAQSALDQMTSAARAYLLAITYPSRSTDAALTSSLAPGAELPTDARTLAVLRRSNWGCPDISERRVQLVADDRSTELSLSFDTVHRLEHITVTNLVAASSA